MKVRCLTNLYGDISIEIYGHLRGYTESSQANIKVGEVYTVYAITSTNGFNWYLVFDAALKYPYYYPQAFFEVVDEKISKYWIVKEAIDFGNIKRLNFGTQEFLEDPFFYGKLLEDDPKCLTIFSLQMKIMDTEY